MDKFEILNEYRRNVRRGLAEPLTCNCGTEWESRLGAFDALVFKCYGCGTVIEVGNGFIARLKAENERIAAEATK